MRGISSGAAAVQALGDAVTGGRGRVTAIQACGTCGRSGHNSRTCKPKQSDAKPLSKGFIVWRAPSTGATGRHATLVDHAAVDAENRRWKTLVAHWLDGCPCGACEKARGEG